MFLSKLAKAMSGFHHKVRYLGVIKHELLYMPEIFATKWYKYLF